MKKILVWLLTAALLLGICGAGAEEAEVSKYESLTVGTTTGFNGNFLSDALGNNQSDLDVRRLIHGYNLVYWDAATGAYQFNEKLVRAATANEEGTSFVFALTRGLTYNDGTPITAADYAFTLLLLGSSELQEACGGRQDLSSIVGGSEYQSGASKTLSGVDLQNEYQFSLQIDPAYMPYFYQLKAVAVSPLPISVIAPGCEVKDDGNGVYISGPFTAELLKTTLLDPVNGYLSHPSVTCGPYMLESFDGTTAELAANPAYIGDQNGIVPRIGHIFLREENPDTLIEHLAEGDPGLVVRLLRQDQIMAGMGLTSSGDYGMKAYSRSGLSYISFCAEKGPTADEAVRKALSMCIDKKTLTEQYAGSFGTTVDGYYGIGQWMFMMANGTMIPEEGEEENWADLNLDGIPVYDFDPEGAAALLEKAGWTAGADGIRGKVIDGEAVQLKLKLIYPEGNGAGPMLAETFVPHLAQAGVSLEIQAMPIEQLLEQYYGQTERTCDLFLLGSNLGDVFDPSGEYDENGTSRLSGITDPELRDLAVEMRKTEPGNAPEYCRRWLRYQARLMEDAAVIPLYSDAYLDFHVAELQDYEPGSAGSWTTAITEAFLGDYVPADMQDLEETEGADEFEGEDEFEE